jgi:hypothetical protein
MLYDMESGYRVVFLLILVVLMLTGAAGCLSSVSGPVPSSSQPASLQPSPAPATGVTIADLALQASDLPSDYLLRDRTVIGYGGISQLDHDLGWQQGYRVSFYRLDKKHDEMTAISQQISIYPPDNINAVYRLTRDAIVPSGYNASGYQIPFPVIGDQSVAWRETADRPKDNITSYSVIFVKNNVVEQITLEGTTTDYELLKTIAQDAAARIQ